MPNPKIFNPKDTFILTSPPKWSKWQCGLFGNDPRKSTGVVWRPEEGKEPNFFWRWMQYIIFGNHWVKDK